MEQPHVRYALVGFVTSLGILGSIGRGQESQAQPVRHIHAHSSARLT